MVQVNKLTSVLLALVASSCLVSCQFSPQSHLGRLVQSFTSPLVLSGGDPSVDGGGGSGGDGYANPGYYSGQDEGQEVQSQAQARPQPVSSRYNQHQGLQQSPSQQSRIPQHYYNNQNEGEELRDQGSAPSNHKGTQESYQMGAYLGPTIDDKEINGAFNSNEDRDEDDGPASYDGMGAGGRGESAGYAPQANYVASSASSGYTRRPGGAANYDPAADSNGNEDDWADEDDMPAEQGRGPKGRGGMNQAASQYRQQGSPYNQAASMNNNLNYPGDVRQPCQGRRAEG